MGRSIAGALSRSGLDPLSSGAADSSVNNAKQTLYDELEQVIYLLLPTTTTALSSYTVFFLFIRDVSR